MKHLVWACAAAALVSACGGGGGGGGGGGSGSPPPVSTTPVNKLAAYVGTWAADCDNHAIDNVTITSPSTNTLTVGSRTDYYAGANCTGAIIATETEGADITATYVDTVDASIVFTPGTAATAAKVDKIVASAPQRTRSVTGTGVTRVVENGKPMWCIAFDGGNRTCIWDEGSTPASSGQAGALYLQGNALYELVPNGAQYTAYGRYVRK